MKIFYLLLCISLSICIHAQDKPQIVLNTGHNAYINTIAFSPDNKYIATGSSDNSIRIWSKSMKQEFRILRGHYQDISKIGYAANGKYLVSIGHSGKICMWNPKKGKLLRKLSLSMRNKYIATFPSKDFFICQKKDKIVAIEIPSGKVLYELDSENKGRGLQISSVSTSPVSSRFISIYDTRAKAVCLYESSSGKLYKKIEASNLITTTAISPDDKKLLIADFTGKSISIIDIEKETVISQLDINTPEYNPKLLFGTKNQTVYVQNTQKPLRQFDVKTGKLIKTIDPDDASSFKMLHDLAIDLQTGIIAQSLYKNSSNSPEAIASVHLIDPKSEQIVGELKGVYKIINTLATDPNERNLIVNKILGKAPGCQTWNIKTGELQKYTYSIANTAFSFDGQYIMTAIPNPEASKLNDPKALKIELMNTVEQNSIFTTYVPQQRNSAISPKGKFVAIEITDYSTNPLSFKSMIWDVEKKELIQTIPYALERGSMMTLAKYQLTENGKYLIVESQKYVTVWDVASNQKISEHIKQNTNGDKDPVIESNLTNNRHNFYCLGIRPGSSNIILAYSKIVKNADLEKQQEAKFQSYLYIWDFLQDTFSTSIATGAEGYITSSNFGADGQYLVVGNASLNSNYGDIIYLWDWTNKKRICQLEGHQDAIVSVWYGNQGKRIYSASADGTIKVWDLKKCQLSASFVSVDALNYIIFSPDGYYKTSKESYQGIGFAYKDELYDFKQFDIHFNRPDKVLTNLGMSKFSTRIYEKAYQKRLQRLGYNNTLDLSSIQQLPQIEIVDKDQLPLSVENAKFKFKISAKDSSTYLDRVHIAVNGVPTPTLRGFDLKGKQLQEKQASYTLRLAEGINRIEVSAFNEQGLESLRQVFDVTYTPEVSVSPDLYILGIGVSEFTDQERNLKFAQKDIQKITEQFANNDYYKDIHTQLIMNQDANRATILEKAKFLKQAKEGDIIIIYISTHGLLDDNLDYYLATHDTDFTNPSEKALPYTEVDKILDGLACRNRLVMIDACHSGEIDKEDIIIGQRQEQLNEGTLAMNTKSGTTQIRPKTGLKNSFSYMKQLFADVGNNTGATVISAASGYEFALESDKWDGGHGVFTYTVLEALQNKKADSNNDGYISINELKNFVTLEVIRLTNGKQQPTTRTENSMHNFRLY
ncbi:MAG: caspase family protein [Saprospiraceae bacterium]|nr:caspase family protein [Saprospiraceae bacterium]